MENDSIIALRMERQCLSHQVGEEEYLELYRDLQPGQNVYWNGFGQPPTLSFRTDFDDLEFNRLRQRDRRLIKGRFGGGNLGWIIPEDLELFAGVYRKPLPDPTPYQELILKMIDAQGPMTIQQIKQETGLLVKEITPALHRLQEAFLIYEDQYDGEWDRSWCLFSELFPQASLDKYSRTEGLARLLLRFAHRMVWFDAKMAKSFYRLPEKEIRQAAAALVREGLFAAVENGFVLTGDQELLETPDVKLPRFIYAIHRNDVLYRAAEGELKAWIEPLIRELPYDHEPLQYLLVDGRFRGAVVGHFRNGPFDLNDVVCDLEDQEARKEEILEAVQAVNGGRMPARVFGNPQ